MFTNQELHNILQVQFNLLPRNHKSKVSVAILMIELRSLIQQRAHVNAFYAYCQETYAVDGWWDGRTN